MSKRVQVSFTDELYDWIKGQADFNGIGVATMVSILVSEARQIRATTLLSSEIFRFLSGLSDKERASFFAAASNQKFDESAPVYNITSSDMEKVQKMLSNYNDEKK